jgi:hypothetical protein
MRGVMCIASRTESDFTGEGCKWSGLCRMPFAAVKKVLGRARKLPASQGEAQFTISKADGSVE